MEREYNRNRSSYRLRKDDNQEDYQQNREERQGRRNYGDRREQRNSGYREGDSRQKRYMARGFSGDGERNRPFERKEYQSGFSRYPGRQSGENGYARNYSRKEGERTGYGREWKEDFRRNGGDREARGRRGEYREYGTGRRNGMEKTEGRYSGKREYPYERRENSDKEGMRQKHYSKKKILVHRLKHEDENAELRLNRFISMGGVCSRRDADELILAGRVKVNGEVVRTVGVKVLCSARVEVDGVQVFPEKKVYLVLNKPKDYVTTVEDPLERKTVMSLVEDACKERIYPVGRLDRQTTGVLLFTNDGDLAKKLTHPKYEHKKIYHVFLDRPLEEQDFKAIASGVDLEDGPVKADEISYISQDYAEVGIEIHSGKNRIVRRIFEHLGYQIVRLDRVYFAGITKKNLLRGKWRFLTDREVNMLKVY